MALRGQELLDFLAEQQPGTSRDEIIKAAGYTEKGRNGSPQVRRTAFLEACAEAAGGPLSVLAAAPRVPTHRDRNRLKVGSRRAVLGRTHMDRLGVPDGGHVTVHHVEYQEGPALIITAEGVTQ